MNFIRHFTAILSLFFITNSVFASDLPQCLSLLRYQEHRLEKIESIRFCFNKYKTTISQNNCFTGLKKINPKILSTGLSEEIKSICFYETTAFKDIKSCLKETKHFKNAINHDEAVFFCFQQFQNDLTEKGCMNTANQLIYPLKREYLKQYCDMNSY